MGFPFPLVEKCKWAWFIGDFGSAFGTVNTRNRNFAFCYVVMTLYEPCSKEIEWNQPGICLQDKRGFNVERYNKLVALGSSLSVKESISELGNFPFHIDCGSSILCWQKHVTSFHPAPSEIKSNFLQPIVDINFNYNLPYEIKFRHLFASFFRAKISAHLRYFLDTTHTAPILLFLV
jgi:hypothetical protein